MKRSAFIAFFIGAQILFVVIQIHKHTLIAQLSYRKQEKEAQKYALIKEREKLINTWYKDTDPSIVQKYAREKLHLEPVSLSQVRKKPICPLPQDVEHDKQNV